MDKPKVLSGQAIVAKGVTKIGATLPEIGLKDVTPNGSWLEQKQIQAALEARKHLVEVERIEKQGTLSHAVWWDDLKLAEVTQKAGGHWQYLGHNVGKTLYLRPEEALFLMEVNCLLLKHGGVTVSLQKAYSLLLTEPTSFIQYRVYSSLSRLGYKVFRHKIPKIAKDDNSCGQKSDSNKKSESIEENLVIDTTVVENITEQPLTDSSVEIVESKNNENDKTDNTNKPLPTIAHINSTEEIIVCKSEANEDLCSKEKSSESTAPGNKVKVENESSSTEKVKENESKANNNTKHGAAIHKMETNYPEANEDKVNTDKNPEPSSEVIIENMDKETQNVETQYSKKEQTDPTVLETPNVETKERETKTLETADTVTLNKMKTEAEVMDVDETADIKTQITEEVDSSSTEKVNTQAEINQTEAVEVASSTVMNTSSSIYDNSRQNIEVQNVKNDNMNNCEDMQTSQTSTDCQEVPDSTMQSVQEANENRNVHSAIAIEVDSADSDVVMDLDTPKSLDFTNDQLQNNINNSSKSNQSLSDVINNKRNQIFHNYVTKLKKLTSRQCKPSNFSTLEKNFEGIPDLFKKEVITINVPEQQYIPKNIFVNNSSYVLNVKEIKSKSVRSVESGTYNSSDEVNGSHVRRIRSMSNSELNQNLQFVNRFPPRQTLFFRPFNFWRPQNNYVQFNMFFQRPYYPNMYYQSRFQYQRPNPLLRSFSYPNNPNLNPNDPNMNNRKRMRSARATHLQSIKNLAVRLKQLIMGGNNHIQNIESLHRLLYAYNTRYKARLRLTKTFEVVNDEHIVETIDLEDDEESLRKRRRLSKDGDMFDENLNLLRQLASKLKDLESKDRASPKHRRAMSKAIKTFNKSYDADIYLNSDFEIINRRLISIESDSESDCVVNEPKKVHKRKKLRNPFNILKRMSEKHADGNPSTSRGSNSKESDSSNIEIVDEAVYSPHISNTFNENWLPRVDDFGRAEVVSKNVMNSRFVDAMKEEYLHNFIKNHFEEFNNWLEAKIAFLQHLEETDIAFQNEHEQMLAARESVNNSGLKPLIDAEDCSDMPSVLEKLRIIKNNKEFPAESSLSIHFDVYNRDVQNFRKTNPPKPHFRIICMEESSRFPSAAEVLSLHSKYEDHVTIVFAIVGISSVSYLQINPIDLPVYVASNDLE